MDLKDKSFNNGRCCAYICLVAPWNRNTAVIANAVVNELKTEI